MKPIRLSQHARENIRYRGATEEEVVETIQTAKWEPTKHERLECRKDFTYEQEWNGKFYATKKVRPIFVEKSEGILVVTVYVYYL